LGWGAGRSKLGKRDGVFGSRDPSAESAAGGRCPPEAFGSSTGRGTGGSTGTGTVVGGPFA
jgi:hypothetical protein